MSHSSRWLFASVCVYLLTQCFNVPILAIGPTWALWPALPDFASALVVLTWLVESRCLEARQASAQRILAVLMLLLFVIVYDRLSKPINRLQTEAAKTGRSLDNGREFQASWNRSLDP